ncbi:MAG: Sec-independent protein translocase protein TatA [Candidatus Collierbacteria bacterium GW2011_GWC1_45_47]|nr:MAG: Sec-independent protein translocase protein TatA [Candidatus Collierbacteria bacterium GW2011_GWA1_44_12]KKT45902.1 MAG: Sec-independent protein translocase protein TatA [Candidatus Collierbacteria bacterium GW2011_GWF2_44_15]KKU08809.1 MAG: Sec-independent protein translocase protein TatA [Candidatus Collierbacteria bacterium GW2011_GWC1_45_47]KKU27455.1 MAG: Sec-independent protein translocase protein TatA [Candidatus Collierbacteria bacterium GW2011_GWE1_46_18]
MEVLLVGLILFLLFGGKKLPELTRGIVNFMKEFRAGLKEGSPEDNK